MTEKTKPMDAPEGTIWRFDEMCPLGALGALRLYPSDVTFPDAGLSAVRKKKGKREYVWPLASEGIDRPSDVRRASIRAVRSYERSQQRDAERAELVAQIRREL